jgi:hypothetical protein
MQVTDAIELLETLGAVNIRERNRGSQGTEIHCDCITSITGHKQKDGNSASFNADTELYSCFSCGAAFNVAQLLFTAGEAYSIGDAIDKARRWTDRPIENWDSSEIIAMLSDDKSDPLIQPEIDSVAAFAYKNMGHSYLTNPIADGGRGVPAKFWREMGIHYHTPSDCIRWPVIDHRGRAIGYIDRPLAYKRYINSEGLKKSKVLYGFTMAQAAIRRGDFDYVWVVEGPGDVVALHALGYYNAVAMLGCRPSREQVYLLSLLSDKILIGLDNDEAGWQGADRLAKMCEGKMSKIWFGGYAEDDHDAGGFDQAQAHSFYENRMTPLQRQMEKLF